MTTHRAAIKRYLLLVCGTVFIQSIFILISSLSQFDIYICTLYFYEFHEYIT